MDVPETIMVMVAGYAALRVLEASIKAMISRRCQNG